MKNHTKQPSFFVAVEVRFHQLSCWLWSMPFQWNWVTLGVIGFLSVSSTLCTFNLLPIKDPSKWSILLLLRLSILRENNTWSALSHMVLANSEGKPYYGSHSGLWMSTNALRTWVMPQIVWIVEKEFLSSLTCDFHMPCDKSFGKNHIFTTQKPF